MRIFVRRAMVDGVARMNNGVNILTVDVRNAPSQVFGA
jgi:hypothetical protein